MFKYRVSILGIIILAILVRIPYLNRPLSVNYEWLMAHTLITYDIWYSEGVVNHHFLPIYTYPDSSNFHIPIGELGSAEKNGRYYYISYPTFGFIIPYLFTFGFAHKPLILKIFNIFLHFFCAFLLWRILSRFFNEFTNFLCFAYFLLQPNLLWFHGNVYFLDTLSMDLFVFQLLITLYYLEKPTTSNSILWLIINFFLCQTEWIGYLVLGVVGFYQLYQKEWKILGILVFWGIFNLGFTFWQYGSYLGYDSYWEALFQKGLKRMGTQNAVSHRWGEWKPFLFFVINFLIFEFTLFLALFFNIGNVLSEFDKLKNQFFSGNYAKIILLAGIPVLLHYLLLFNFTTGHPALAAVVFNPFLIFLLAPLLEHLTQLPNSLGKKIGLTINFTIILMGLVFFLFRNNHTFQNYFKYHMFAFQHTPFDEFEKLGKVIQKDTPKGFVAGVICPRFLTNPQTIFYAKKNIIQFFSTEEAKQYVQQHEVKLKVYEINDIFTIEKSYELLP